MAGPLKNARHERFAQERAKGQSVDKSFIAAGFKANRGNAARLNANESVRARIHQLQSKAAEKTVVTVAGITDSLIRIAKKGEALKEPAGLSVARASLMDAAKLNGLVIDRSKVGFDFGAMSDEDLENLERILSKTAQP